jgi:hypothetical protein
MVKLKGRIKRCRVNSMIAVCFGTAILISCQLSAVAQPVFHHDSGFSEKELAAILSFLSDDEMEGREAGTRGASISSGFISVLMQMNGLKPFGDKITAENKFPGQGWFQNFKMVRWLSTGKESIKPDVSPVPEEIEYSDGDYYLPGDTIIDNPGLLIDTLCVRNVLGIIYGKDTTKSIIIGAHYDHLGIRNGSVYNGADDNASGVAGMLTLAGKWARSGEIPSCNLIFAAWTAEEKGQLGSRYFVHNSRANQEKVIISFNLDMISRSAPEDTSGRQLSIGTLPVSENLRQMARDINRGFRRPFELDLWDVSGHTGSDYRFFSNAGIPVMTFFSGYNSDYHTPGDVASKTDYGKMIDILILLDESIKMILRLKSPD